MSQNAVGIRELKTHLSRYLRQLHAGATLVVTDRGRPVARIVPIQESVEDRIAELQQAGLLAWNGQRLPDHEPKVRPHGRATVADLLLEDRE